MTGTAGQRATFSVGSILPNVAMTEFPVGTYTGRVSVANLRDGVHTVTVSLNDGPSATAGSLTVDTAAPAVTVDASPATAANGDTVTITATVSEAATSVTADVSALDTTQTAPILLTLSNNTYSGSFTIGDNNQAAEGMQTITVTATDAAGNRGAGYRNRYVDKPIAIHFNDTGRHQSIPRTLRCRRARHGGRSQNDAWGCRQSADCL